MRQAWILIIMSIHLVIGTTILFSTLGYTILMLWVCKKSFFSINFLIIEVHPWNETNLDTSNNLYSCSYWHYNHVLHIRIHGIDALDLQDKLFFPFRVINVDLWNETNLDTCNNLHSFCYWHYNHVLLIGIHDIDSLDLREKLFFESFSI